jgi:Glycosyltransferase family 87
MVKARSIGYILLGIGILIVAFAILSDSIGIGKKGIQAAQLLLIQAGVLLIFLSVGFINLNGLEIRFSDLVRRVRISLGELPPFAWILIGFFITYIILFVFPVFFNTGRSISYLARYLPEARPIGRDLAFNTSSIANWLSGNGLYDFENHYYPPLYAVVFSPFLLLDYPITYYVMTAITLLSIVVVGLIIPELLNGSGRKGTGLFFFISVIFSYGMQFELERGQFNVFAFMLSLVAVYIFHRHHSFRLLAYLLISVSIQIKLYPIVYILLLVKDWHDWKGNILRFVGLGLLNFSLLFILGYQVFVDFLGALPNLMGAFWIRPYNHSLVSFVNEFATTGFGVFQDSTMNIVDTNSGFIKLILTVFYFLCVVIVVVRAYKNNENDLNLDLLLVCTIGALILPSVSIDYKLPLLAPSMALALSYQVKAEMNIYKKIAVSLILVVITIAYSFTLFSFVHRPALVANSFPLFIVILVSTTLLNILENRVYKKA